MTRFTVILLALPLAFGAAIAEATVVKVPGDADTLQAAVAIAKPGDTVQVGAGRWCGAVIDKSLNLVGAQGAVIVGKVGDVTCDGPFVAGVYPAGFVLPSAKASGTTIRHFTFDGAQVATDASVLALAVYARDDGGGKINDVRIEHNTVLGTFQTITDRGGDDWVISHNEILGLTTQGGVGGFGIVVLDHGGARPQRVSITHNRIDGEVPSPSWSTWFPGIFVAGADMTEVAHNRFRLAPMAGSTSEYASVGVLVTEGAAGGTRGARITSNDGAASDFVAVIDGSGGTNTTGLELKDNVGSILVEGVLYTAPDRRAAKALEKADKHDGKKGDHSGRLK